MNKPAVAIIGASTDRAKFGNKAVRAHVAQGFEVYPVNRRADSIEGLTCYPSILDVPAPRLHRVSLYLPPAVGLKVLPDIAQKGCDELWLNPGSESDELVTRARELGFEPILACSIVALGVSPSEFSDE